jgi:hypothetical protein
VCERECVCVRVNREKERVETDVIKRNRFFPWAKGKKRQKKVSHTSSYSYLVLKVTLKKPKYEKNRLSRILLSTFGTEFGN